MFFQNNLDYVELNDCLACGEDNLVPVLSLGNQPLANSLMDSKKETPKAFPLAINRCSNCFHVQLTHAVNPDLMFKNYLYVSGTSKTMDDHFKWFAKYTCEYFTALTALKPSRVLDIGCNDGSQLNHFKTLGLGTFGVDPATNLLSMSSKKHCVYPDYFNIDFVTKNPGTYDIITAQNVFAHNYDPKGFLTSARNIMSNDSLLFIQTSQADMILNNEFDTIYHEHISFFNIRSMRHLCDRSGLYLVDVIKCPLHGNSYIFVISRNKTISRPFNIQNLEDMEQKNGLYSPLTHTEYALRVEDISAEFKMMMNVLKKKGVKIIGYGAAAKGMTFLNYTGMNDSYIDYIVDDNPLKQNKFTPGSGILIDGSHRIALENEKTQIAFIPLAWNFYNEIRSRIKSSRNISSDLFVRYFPQVEMTQ